MVLLSSHTVERKCPLGIRASQQMRAASGDPRRGAIPVELIRSQPSGDLYMKGRSSLKWKKKKSSVEIFIVQT